MNESSRTLLLPAPGPRRAMLMALMPPCERAAEIGADHGIISAHLLRSNRCRHMIVADISAASLGKARRLFDAHGLDAQATFRVADGLQALDAPPDAILIAGMGAAAIVRILAADPDRIGDAALVLQPNQDLTQLRGWLGDNGYRIEAEQIAREGRRFYVALRARRGPEAALSEREALLGPILLRERPEHFEAYLRWRHACLLQVRREGARQAIQWIEEALEP